MTLLLSNYKNLVNQCNNKAKSSNILDIFEVSVVSKSNQCVATLREELL